MRAAMLVNSRSGRGRAGQAADALEAHLGHRGVACERVAVGAPSADLHAACRGVDVVVVAGGDGTVRSMVPVVRTHRAALAILPTGTENLAAKAFGFSIAPAHLADAVAAGRVRRVDVGRANLAPFLVMASVGFDADLVRRVNDARRGPIRRVTYVRAALAMACAWRPTPVRVEADGTCVFEGLGQVIVANCPQYAAGLNPVRWARPADGLLSYAVLPAVGVAHVARWALRLTRRRWGGEGAVQGSAQCVELHATAPCAAQVDGDPLGKVRCERVTFDLEPGGLALVDTGAHTASPPGSPGRAP